MQEREQVPDLLVEQLALGELSGQGEVEVFRQLVGQPGGLERLAAIWVSNAQILQTYPPSKMAAMIRYRLSRTRRRTALHWLLWSGVPAMATASVVLLLVARTAPPQLDRAKSDPPPHLRTKGATGTMGTPLLFAFKKQEQNVHRLEHGAEVYPGDLLQIAYQGGEETHGVIVSVDGRGVVTLHFPARPDQSTRLHPGGTRVLPYAFELDDAPDFERFLLFTARNAIDVHPLVEEIKRLVTLQPDLLAFPAGHETLLELAEARGLGVREMILIKRAARDGY